MKIMNEIKIQAFIFNWTGQYEKNNRTRKRIF